MFQKNFGTKIILDLKLLVWPQNYLSCKNVKGATNFLGFILYFVIFVYLHCVLSFCIFTFHYACIMSYLYFVIYSIQQDWVAFMSQPYWVKVMVEAELGLRLRLKLGLRLSWGWVRVEVEIELSLICGSAWVEVEFELKLVWDRVVIELELK